MGFNTGAYSSTKLMGEIKYLIKDNGLTQDKLAKELGYSRKVINRQLNDPFVKKDYELIVKICKRLGIKAIVIE